MALIKRLILGRKGLAALTVSVSAISMAFSLVWNLCLSILINQASAGLATSPGILLRALAVILLIAAAAYAFVLLSGWTCETLGHDLRMGYARHFVSLSYEQMECLNAGEQLSGLQNEIGEALDFMSGHLFPFADDAVKFAATFGFMVWLDPALALAANAPSFLILAYTVFSSRVIGEAAKETQEANARMNGFAAMLLDVFPVLRLFDATPLMMREYQTVLRAWEKASTLEERRRSLLMSLSGLLSVLPLLLLFLMGGLQVIRGDASLGTLYIFINLSGNISGVLMNLPGRIAMFRRFEANMGRLQGRILLGEGRAEA